MIWSSSCWTTPPLCFPSETNVKQTKILENRFLLLPKFSLKFSDIVRYKVNSIFTTGFHDSVHEIRKALKDELVLVIFLRLI